KPDDAQAQTPVDAGAEEANTESATPDAAAEVAAIDASPPDPITEIDEPAPKPKPAPVVKRKKKMTRAEIRREALRKKRERQQAEREAAAARERERQRLAAEREAARRNKEPAQGTVNILVKPSGSSLALDGVFIGTSPMRGIKTSPGSHRLAASSTGYKADTTTFTVRAGRTATVRISLDKLAPKPAPVVKADTTTTVQRRPRTPRVSADGSASRGRGLVGSACNSCHRKRGVGGVSPRRYTRAGWDRFFAGGYHDRYERLGGVVSGGTLSAVKAYLKSRARDVESNKAGE
ncbi:MAG: PEGA domain-containing protein, partial [Deltaproteobacteria bacterium]|nr:PEGA domain-containing protein [Deltaproteobacteria bacterium]